MIRLAWLEEGPREGRGGVYDGGRVVKIGVGGLGLLCGAWGGEGQEVWRWGQGKGDLGALGHEGRGPRPRVGGFMCWGRVPWGVGDRGPRVIG